MPYTLSRLDDGKGVLLLGTGTISDDEYAATMTSHLNEPQEIFGQLYYSLTDLTRVESITVSSETIKAAASLGRLNFERNPRVVVAIAAPADLPYGLSRLWHGFVGDDAWTTGFYRDRTEAETWIRKECLERFGLDDLTFK